MRVSDRRTIEGYWRSYIARNEAKLRKDLASTWKRQAGMITVSDLRFASASGKVPQRLLKDWQEAYARFVNAKLVNHWETAAGSSRWHLLAGLEKIGVRPGKDSYLEAMDQWVYMRGGRMITGLSEAQADAVNTVLRWHTINDPLSAREMADVLEPMVPLTKRQAMALSNRRQALIADGITGAELASKVGDYALALQRVRSIRIARTEIATAYNQGALTSIQSAISDGDLAPGATKEWLTADDERVCSYCGPLDEIDPIPIDDSFSAGPFTADAPPIHPQCRCTLLYDVEPAEERQELESLQLSDDDRKRFYSDTYGGQDIDFNASYGGNKMREDMLARNLNNSFAAGFTRQSDKAKSNARGVRDQLSRLVGEFGIPSYDILESKRWAGYATQFRTTKGVHWFGAHGWSGDVTIREDHKKYALSFMKGSRGKRNASGITTLVHEQLHGSSRVSRELYSRGGFWAALEEATTEGAARGIVSDKFGARGDDKGYRNMMNRVADAVGGSLGTDRARGAALFERASIRFKRIPTAKNGKRWLEIRAEAIDDLARSFDGYAKMSDEGKESLRTALKDSLERGIIDMGVRQ